MQKDPERVGRLLPYFRDYRDTWNTAVAQFKAIKNAQRTAQGGSGGSTFAAVG
jgi:hypothetical protein